MSVFFDQNGSWYSWLFIQTGLLPHLCVSCIEICVDCLTFFHCIEQFRTSNIEGRIIRPIDRKHTSVTCGKEVIRI